MRIALTGGNGFIGREIMLQLQNSYQIDSFDFRGPHQNPFDLLKKIREGEFFDYILHFGANSNAQERGFELNILENTGYSFALAAAAAAKDIPFIFASSAAIYGSESSEVLSPYATTKFQSEQMISMLSNTFPKWRNISLRLSNIFGAGEQIKDKMMSIPSRFSFDAKEKGCIEVWSKSINDVQTTPSRDFLHVSKLVEIIRLLINSKDWPHQVTDVGRGESTTFEYIAEIVSREILCEVKIVPIPENINPDYYQFNTKANTTRIEQIVGKIHHEPIEIEIVRLVTQVINDA